MGKIKFAIVIHNNQPKGNFEEIFERCYKKAYRPFLDVLKKHKKIKINIHFSGVILEYIEREHADFIEDIRGLLKEGRVELMTGGYYEPILPVIKDEDKVDQIIRLTSKISDLFGATAKGVWLAERVWEPHLPKALSKAGAEYAVVDDDCFLNYAGKSGYPYGYFVTEDQGFPVRLFAIQKKLRDMIPFDSVDNCVDFIKSQRDDSGNRIVVFADDGEKFGEWPYTYESVYEKKWLHNFFMELEKNASGIETALLSEYMEKQPPLGLAYVPAYSYLELTEWALNMDKNLLYQELLDKLRKTGDFEKQRSFLRGGFWRNFFIKYPESDNMHCRYLELSKKSAGTDRTKLCMSQCNCAYWHGSFGGVYFPHLRAEVYRNLIAFEKSVEKEDAVGLLSKMEKDDFNYDGLDEIKFRTADLNIYLNPKYGACIYELDYKPSCVNVCDSFTRQKEPYHAKQNMDVPVDWYRRGFFINHFLHPETKISDFSKCRYGEQGDFVNGRFTFSSEDGNVARFFRDGVVWSGSAPNAVRLEKIVSVAEEDSFRLDCRVMNEGKNRALFIPGTEFNLGAMATTVESMGLRVNGEPAGKEFLSNGGLLKETEFKQVKNFRFENSHLNYYIDFSPDREMEVWIFPVETFNLMIVEINKILQGFSLLFFSPVELGPREDFHFGFRIKLGNLC